MTRRTIRSLKRRPAFREPKLAIIIYAEGKNTEPNYIYGFAALHGNSLVKVKCHGGQGVPATLVQKARDELLRIRRSRDRLAKTDQVWIVFDEDEHPLVRQSITVAKALGIGVAYSNPCFEVWLILHFADFDSSEGRKMVQRRLTALSPSYDPSSGKTADFQELSNHYALAEQRARRMRVRREREGAALEAPYTDFDLLTELIIKNGK